MKKICPTCKQTFEITQYQKKKFIVMIFASQASDPTEVNQNGRPKNEI